jgi:hypothetical protein
MAFMIIRTYQCNECAVVFDVEMDSGSDGDPDCPECAKVLQWIPGEFSIKTSKSRAIDYTQKMVEADYGMTDMNDGSREGDIAAKAPAPMQTAEQDQIAQSVMEYVRETTTLPASFKQPTPPQAQAVPITPTWGTQAPAINTNTISAQAALAAAKVGPGSEVNAMTILQQGIKSGHLAAKARIISRWKP